MCRTPQAGTCSSAHTHLLFAVNHADLVERVYRRRQPSVHAEGPLLQPSLSVGRSVGTFDARARRVRLRVPARVSARKRVVCVKIACVQRFAHVRVQRSPVGCALRALTSMIAESEK